MFVCVCDGLCSHIKSRRERETYKGRHKLSAGLMNFRPIYLVNEPLEGIHPQTVPWIVRQIKLYFWNHISQRTKQEIVQSCKQNCAVWLEIKQAMHKMTEISSPVDKIKCWQFTLLQNTYTFTFGQVRGCLPWHFHKTCHVTSTWHVFLTWLSYQEAKRMVVKFETVFRHVLSH